MDREAPEPSPAPSAALIQREIPLLIKLAPAPVVLFLCTRAVAGWDASITAHAASWWYQRGIEALRARNTDRAIDAFRQAAAEDPSDTRYALALAAGLPRRIRPPPGPRWRSPARSAAPPIGRTRRGGFC